MKFNYKLQRLCGSSYGSPNTSNTTSTSAGPNILYTASGNTLLSPVSNRIQVIDLLTHSCRTISCESRSNIKLIALSPIDDRLLLVIDVENYATLINFHRSVILHRFKFHRPVKVCEFSPCGGYIAVGYGNHVQVWLSPGVRREFSPMVLFRTYVGLGDGVTCLTWSGDSSVIVAGCRNGTVRVWTVATVEGYTPITLSGHKRSVVGVYFEMVPKAVGGGRIRRIYTVSADGAMAAWDGTYTDEDGEEDVATADFMKASNAAVGFFGNSNQASGFDSNNITTLTTTTSTQKKQAQHMHKIKSWKVATRHYFQQASDVTASTFSATHNLLVVGFASGTFGLYELPSMSNVHTLSLASNTVIRTISLNDTGEWLAFGCPSTQQLLVWEWRSESYIIKQRGHTGGMMKCMAYSGDGVVVATGGEDGALKLWNSSSGFCYCTMKSHTAPVTAVVFANSSVVLTSSLDGTVRAHDLNRYRNFKTYTTPTPHQFTSLAVDPTGEIIASGTLDPFYIYTWSLQTGKLLDVLTGHVGPVSELTFHPTRGTLASGSWDGTVKVWDLYKGKEGEPESMNCGKDVVCCAFRGDGEQICAGGIGGVLSFWKVEDCSLVCEIDGRMDIAGGRKINDRMTSDNNSASRYFTSVCYSADGTCVLAGGNSKFVCVYEISQRVLVKKFQISYNRSLDGVLDKLNSKNLADGGPNNGGDGNDSADDDVNFDPQLPGARRADDGSRKSRVEVMTTQVAFSSTGREWATVSSEGLHIYSLDDDMIFDPISLTEDITPSAVLSNLLSGRHGIALVISLHLNEFSLIRHVLENTPYESIPHVVKSIGPMHLEKSMQYIAECMKDSPHVEFYVQWCLEMLNTHGVYMEKRRGRYMRAFRGMCKAVQIQNEELRKLSDDNGYMLEFVEDQSKLILEQNR